MTEFYTNFFRKGNKVFCRGYRNGKRFNDQVDYKPFLFVKDMAGQKFKTIYGEPVRKKKFESIRDAREFMEKNERISNVELYGYNKFEYVYIYERYKEIEYDYSKLNIGSIDIECRSDTFPNIKTANKEITAITIRKNKKNYVFGYIDFKHDDNTRYYKCRDEIDLLSKFIIAWKTFDFDILTGWNIQFFDLPYIINRIKRILGEEKILELAPFGFIEEKEVVFKGKKNNTYEIPGISILDYYELYRKYSFGNQEDYKLNTIAKIELDKGKLDYSDFKHIDHMMTGEFEVDQKEETKKGSIRELAKLRSLIKTKI